MNGFAHTGVANATLANQYAVVSQIQNSSYNWIAGGGTADAITAAEKDGTVALNALRVQITAQSPNVTSSASTTATTTPTS